MGKVECKKQILKALSQKQSRAVILDRISNKELHNWIQEGCGVLGITLISEIPTGLVCGFDAVITDTSLIKEELQSLMHEGIVPIFPSTSDFDGALEGFNPMKFTGNAFLFDQNTKFHVFEQIVRFLENSKYAGDRATLNKNVVGTTL